MKRELNRLADYSDNSLLEEVRRVADVLGKTPTLEEFEKYARCSYAVLKKRFGGLRAALIRAGLKPDEFHRNISDVELLSELSRIWDIVLTREGWRPYKNDLLKYHSRFSQGPYYRRWGSWIRACEALLAREETSIQKERHIAGNIPPKKIKKRKRAIPLRVRYAILLRDRFTCQICGKSPATSSGTEVDVDHIIPESRGGTLEPSNLRVLCRKCNLGKGNIMEW